MMSKKAFTLIELLVVIAIIILLISLLIPSLRYAKELAKMTACMGNLHSLGTGVGLYAMEYGNSLPPSVGNPSPLNSFGPHSLWPHSGSSSSEAETASQIYSDFLVETGAASKEHFDCPSSEGTRPIWDRSTSPWSLSGKIEGCSGYQMNPFFKPYRVQGYEAWGGNPIGSYYSVINERDEYRPARISKLAYLSEGMLLADGAPGEGSPFLDTHAWWGYDGDFDNNRHISNQNALLLDGHAESREPENFWPYLYFGQYNKWDHTKFWWPIEVSDGPRPW